MALQFCHKDWLRAAKLANLLATLEGSRRGDVALLFVRASDFVENPVMDRVISRCSEVFRVEHVFARPDSPARRSMWPCLREWIEGSNILWTAAVEHVLGMGPQWGTVFFADGGDGAPMHRDWVNVVVADHAETVRRGLHVTGALRDCLGVLHVNGNHVVERSFLAAHPEFLDAPSVSQEWDVHHAATIVPAARVSSLVYGGWHQFGATPAQVEQVARHSAWWHGCKDGNFVDLVSEHVLADGRRLPEIVDLGPASDLRHSRFSP